MGGYPKSRKLVVRDLAERLWVQGGKVNQEVWNELETSGAISGIRRRDDGSIISLSYGGKRFRAATLVHFISAHQPTEKENTMPADKIRTDQPLPGPLQDSLTISGFSPADIEALSKDLRAIDDINQRAKDKTKQAAKSIDQKRPRI